MEMRFEAGRPLRPAAVIEAEAEASAARAAADECARSLHDPMCRCGKEKDEASVPFCWACYGRLTLSQRRALVQALRMKEGYGVAYAACCRHLDLRAKGQA